MKPRKTPPTRGLAAVVHARLVRLFRFMVLRSIIVESVDEANTLLANGWRLNNLDTQNSRWAGDPSRIRFMLVRLSRLGIFMPKSVNKDLLERPILFGRWPSDAGSDNMPASIKKHSGDGSLAMMRGFNFFDFAKHGSVHSGVNDGGGDSSNSLPNVRVVAPPPLESKGVEIEGLKGGCPPTACSESSFVPGPNTVHVVSFTVTEAMERLEAFDRESRVRREEQDTVNSSEQNQSPQE